MDVLTLVLLIFGAVCVLLGIVFLLLFRYLRLREQTLEHSLRAQAWGRLTGTESRIERNYENRSHTVYYGVYEFETADGQQISGASDFGWYAPEKVPGAQGNAVKILYDPQKPTEFSLAEERAVSKTIWPKFRKVGVLLTVIGVLLTAAGVAAALGVFDPLLQRLAEAAEDGAVSVTYSFSGD